MKEYKKQLRKRLKRRTKLFRKDKRTLTTHIQVNYTKLI